MKSLNMLVSFIFGLSVLSANTLFAKDLTLDKADSKLLFGNEEVNVQVLSQEEMEQTRGESFFGALMGGLIIGGLGWLECKVNGGSGCGVRIDIDFLDI